MQSNGTSGEKKVNSWRRIRGLLASGVTRTEDICLHTGLSKRRVQEVRKDVRDRGAYLAKLRDTMKRFQGTRVVLPSGIVEERVFTNVWTYTGGNENE